MFKGNKRKKIIILGLLVLSLLTSSIALADQLNNSEELIEQEETSRAHKIYEVKKGDYTEVTSLRNAEVISLRNDSVRIDHDNGVFGEYLVDNLQEVKKGDPLISYTIGVDLISIEEMKMNLVNREDGFSKGLSQRQEELANLRNALLGLESGSNDEKKAKINIQKKEIGLERYINDTEKSLEDTKEKIRELESNLEPQYVYAPYNGIVFFFEPVKEGAAINRGTHLLQIIDTDSVFLSAPSSANDKLWYNMEVSVTLITNRQEDTTNVYKGRIISADSLINRKVSSETFYILLENAKDVLNFGQTANVYAEEIRVEDVIIIPSSSVNMDSGKRYVYILDDSGAMQKQYITGRDNGVEMWVYNGLEVGQQIIAD